MRSHYATITLLNFREKTMSGNISTAILDFSENLDNLTQEELQEKFDKLKAQWEQDTAILSSISRKIKHPAYQKIIFMGEKALPLIFRALQQDSGHWFYALAKITQADPVKPEDNYEQAVEAWLNWGREQGYIK